MQMCGRAWFLLAVHTVAVAVVVADVLGEEANNSASAQPGEERGARSGGATPDRSEL